MTIGELINGLQDYAPSDSVGVANEYIRECLLVPYEEESIDELPQDYPCLMSANEEGDVFEGMERFTFEKAQQCPYVGVAIVRVEDKQEVWLVENNASIDELLRYYGDATVEIAVAEMVMFYP